MIQSGAEKKPNRLIHEKSPYLLQHAHNPVDWYPWSDEAFAKAKIEDKPVFVSIGYSTCHWCHVMEQECFEDQQVAELMNEAFVSIKVDREERPDIDGTFMTACQAMGRSCGWPLNVIMTADKNPFFVTSYIPKQNRFGIMGMVDLIPQISEVWRTRRSELEAVGADVRLRIADAEKRSSTETLGKDVLDEAYEKFTLMFDSEHGGFGEAPKFPTPQNLLFLLRYWKRTGEKNALNMVEKTLRSMRSGGIFDQLGFGFHRYSTDAEWLVPHFEKMLSDQALLAFAYLETFQATGTMEFAYTSKNILQYVMRDLTSTDGGFFSAEDADTEGEEGKFYLWTEAEIRDILPQADADLAVKFFGVNEKGNYYDSGARGGNRKNILHVAMSIGELAADSNIAESELAVRIEEIERVLYGARQKRVHPAKDDKILTDWNGLMIAALAKASRILDDHRHLDAAIGTADFILTKMRDTNGNLFHRYVKDERAVEGFLDDYAFLVFGLIEIYETNFDEKYLQAASELTESMVAKFWDGENGGFFSTSSDANDVLVRRREVYDGALPSGNSVAFQNLLQLAQLTGNASYESMSVHMMQIFSPEVNGSPAAHAFFLLGMDFAVGPAFNIVLVGEKNWDSMSNMIMQLRKSYLPNLVVSIKTTGKAGFGYEVLDGKATAYVCRDKMCLPATNDVSKMLELIQSKP